MGLARQSVQRLADVLVAEGLCEYQPNPAHRRAKLVIPTASARAAIEHIHPIQVDWSDRVGAALGLTALRHVTATIARLLETLDSPAGAVTPPSAARAKPRGARRGAPRAV
jgi:DNA-binding MarR family transcriptional regulator